MRLQQAATNLDWAVPAGVTLTLAAVLASDRVGSTGSLGSLLVLALFAAMVATFMLLPHVAVALTIPLFAALPTIKTLALPSVGPVKDLVVLAGCVAAALLLAQRTRQGQPIGIDLVTVALVALFLAVYVVNPGGLLAQSGGDAAWVQGTRLAAEPLLLLLVGMTLADPRRTLRWGLISLLATAAAVAAWGIAQQVLGQWALVDLGYSFGDEVRTIGGRLRSFGTLDDPFTYVTFLLLAGSAALLWSRRNVLTVSLLGVIAAGITFSYVRTALVIALAIFGLWLARRGHNAAAIFIIAAAAAVALAIMIMSSEATESRTVRGKDSQYLTINGRTDVWRSVLGDPKTWVLGRGVGEVGTAATRATYTLVRDRDALPDTTIAVDSGYLATVADVGLVGLVLLLVLVGRLLHLATAAIRRDDAAGWAAVGLLTVILLDAATRAAFTGFPAAFLGFMLVGVALAAARPAASEATVEAGPAVPR